MVAAVEKDIQNSVPIPDVQEGDRVCGRSLEGQKIEGIVTSIGIKYAVLNGDSRTSVWLESIEILERASEVKEVPWTYIPGFLSQKHADQWLERSQEINWQHNDIRMFGKEIPLPRLEAILGDGDYSYSGVTLKAQPWTDEFLALKEWIEKECGYSFQIAIGNQYRNGSEHIGWHSDDSPEMGDRPAIASISLGATRKFQLRHKQTKEVHTFELTHGSLFVMHPGCQEEWQHRICKVSGDVGLRINWTFRPLVGQTQETTSNQEPETSNSSALAIPADVIDAEIVPGRVEQLADLEAQIQQGVDLCKQGEQQIWIAAHQIRSLKLFEAAGFENFEKYCLHRWGWEKSNAHEVAGAGEVVLQLQASGVEIPASVAAIRPLRKLQPEQRLKALEVAKETGKLTAETVKQAVAVLTAPPPPPPSKYEFEPIEPRQCWFRINDVDWMEAQAIAKNAVPMYRLVWGEETGECDVPERNVRWEKPAELLESRDSVNEAAIGQLTDPDELSPEEKSLLHTLKQLSQAKSDEIYNALLKLKPDADLKELADITDEINTAILDVLEFHFL